MSDKKVAKAGKKEVKIPFDAYFSMCGKPNSWKNGMKYYLENCSKLRKTKMEWDKHFAKY